MNCNNTTHPNACLTNTSDDSVWVAPDFNVSVSNIVLAVTLTILDVVTVFGNILVLLAFVIEKRLLQPFNIFILNLAVTDFLVAITAMPFYTLDTLLGYWPFGTILCGVWIYFDFALTFASVFTLVAISVDRFWCVTWAFHYKLHRNKTNTAIIVAVIWFCVIAIWTPPFIGDLRNHSEQNVCIWEPSNNTEFVIFVAVIGHYLPCVIMIFCYIKVFLVMRRQALGRKHSDSYTDQVHEQPVCMDMTTSAGDTDSNQLNNDHTNVRVIDGAQSTQNICTVSGQYNICDSTPSRSPNSNTSYREQRSSHSQAREKRIFVTLTYVLSSYLICWFPFYIVFDTYAWKPDLVPAGLYSFFFWLTYLNSTLNPIIYAYTNQDFRSAFIKVLKLMCKCSK